MITVRVNSIHVSALVLVRKSALILLRVLTLFRLNRPCYLLSYHNIQMLSLADAQIFQTTYVGYFLQRRIVSFVNLEVAMECRLSPL